MKIKIIYEDKNILAVDKPSGLLVHPASTDASQDGPLHSREETLSDWVLEKYPKTENVGEPLNIIRGKPQTSMVIKRPGIVHRLDKETSGVILIAKNQQAFECLKKQFQQREMGKIYRAFVWGSFAESTGIIDRPIGRSGSDFRKKSSGKRIKGVGRAAITEYKVLTQNRPYIKNQRSYNYDVYAYLEVYPKTGRTHQIRVHLKSIGRPIVCDALYAPKKPPALGFNRLALHAFSITFKNLKGDTITAEAPLPEDFINAEKRLQNIE